MSSSHIAQRDAFIFKLTIDSSDSNILIEHSSNKFVIQHQKIFLKKENERKTRHIFPSRIAFQSRKEMKSHTSAKSSSRQ